jgi:hypothetical protein
MGKANSRACPEGTPLILREEGNEAEEEEEEAPSMHLTCSPVAQGEAQRWKQGFGIPGPGSGNDSGGSGRRSTVRHRKRFPGSGTLQGDTQRP